MHVYTYVYYNSYIKLGLATCSKTTRAKVASLDAKNLPLFHTSLRRVRRLGR